MDRLCRVDGEVVDATWRACRRSEWLLLAMLARACRFDLVPGRPVEHDPAITLRIRGGLPVTVRRRWTAPAGEDLDDIAALSRVAERD